MKRCKLLFTSLAIITPLFTMSTQAYAQTNQGVCLTSSQMNTLQGYITSLGSIKEMGKTSQAISVLNDMINTLANYIVTPNLERRYLVHYLNIAGGYLSDALSTTTEDEFIANIDGAISALDAAIKNSAPPVCVPPSK